MSQENQAQSQKTIKKTIKKTFELEDYDVEVEVGLSLKSAKND